MKWVGLVALFVLALEVAAFLLVSRFLRSPVFAIWMLGLAFLVGLSLINRGKAQLDPANLMSGRSRPSPDGLAGLLTPLISGVLLAFPGFLTDVIALAIFIPPVRRAFAQPLFKLVSHLAQRAFAKGMVPPEAMMRAGRRVVDADFEVLDR